MYCDAWLNEQIPQNKDSFCIRGSAYGVYQNECVTSYLYNYVPKSTYETYQGLHVL